jgi:hypothetical protein
MSGNYFLIPPLPLSAHEENYKQAITALGLADIPAYERVRALMEIPAQELASRLEQSVIVAPAIDGDIVVDRPTFSDLADPKRIYPKGKNWCEALLIGDAEMDVSSLHQSLVVVRKHPLIIRREILSEPSFQTRRSHARRSLFVSLKLHCVPILVLRRRSDSLTTYCPNFLTNKPLPIFWNTSTTSHSSCRLSRPHKAGLRVHSFTISIRAIHGKVQAKVGLAICSTSCICFRTFEDS